MYEYVIPPFCNGNGPEKKIIQILAGLTFPHCVSCFVGLNYFLGIVISRYYLPPKG